MAIPQADQYTIPGKVPPLASDTAGGLSQVVSIATEVTPGATGAPLAPKPRALAFEVETILSMYASRYASGITVGVTTTKLCDVNPNRRLAIITNDSANDMYLSFNSQPAVGGGIRLNAGGGVMIFGAMSDIPWGGEVWAITTVAGNATVVEA
jgi:hypothetical protein